MPISLFLSSFHRNLVALKSSGCLLISRFPACNCTPSQVRSIDSSLCSLVSNPRAINEDNPFPSALRSSSLRLTGTFTRIAWNASVWSPSAAGVEALWLYWCSISCFCLQVTKASVFVLVLIGCPSHWTPWSAWVLSAGHLDSINRFSSEDPIPLCPREGRSLLSDLSISPLMDVASDLSRDHFHLAKRIGVRVHFYLPLFKTYGLFG